MATAPLVSLFTAAPRCAERHRLRAQPQRVNLRAQHHVDGPYPHREEHHEAAHRQDGQPDRHPSRQRAVREQGQRGGQHGQAHGDANRADVKKGLPADVVDQDDGDYYERRLGEPNRNSGAKELTLRRDAGVPEYGRAIVHQRVDAGDLLVLD